jgi:hypothetical protein
MCSKGSGACSERHFCLSCVCKPLISLRSSTPDSTAHKNACLHPQPHSHPRGLCSCRDYPTVEGYLARASDAHLIGPSGKDCSVDCVAFHTTLQSRQGPANRDNKADTYVRSHTHHLAPRGGQFKLPPRSFACEHVASLAYPAPHRAPRSWGGQCKLNEAPRSTTSRCACALIVGLIASSATSLRVTRATGGWPPRGQFKLALR